MARYTLIIGTRNWSSWSLRAYMALRAAGQPFETIDIRLRQETTRQQILHYSPAAKLPILRIEEGDEAVTVWDSLAICETIAERHPQTALWPEDAKSRALARSYACEMHSGFAGLRRQLSLDFVRTKPLPELEEETRSEIARVQDAWSQALLAHQGGFLFGRLSVADCMYAPVVSRFATYGVSIAEPIKTYMARILALPAMEEWRQGAQREVDAGLA